MCPRTITLLHTKVGRRRAPPYNSAPAYYAGRRRMLPRPILRLCSTAGRPRMLPRIITLLRTTVGLRTAVGRRRMNAPSYNPAHPHRGSLQPQAAGTTVQMPSDYTNSRRQNY